MSRLIVSPKTSAAEAKVFAKANYQKTLESANYVRLRSFSELRAMICLSLTLMNFRLYNDQKFPS